jgi:uncharacterized protein YeaO (DUF488 family)
MPIKTKRWNDPKERDDGLRLLICRYRPRGLRKADETWDDWRVNLGPSRKLHADFYGKNGPPIGWDEYRRRYVNEMEVQKEAIRELASYVTSGATLTLLCSSACLDASHCHRTLLAGLIEEEANRGVSIAPDRDHKVIHTDVEASALAARPVRGRRKKSTKRVSR